MYTNYIISIIILLITSILFAFTTYKQEHFENNSDKAINKFIELKKLKEHVQELYSDALLSWRRSNEKPTDKTTDIIRSIPKLTNKAQDIANEIHKLDSGSELSMNAQNIVMEIDTYNDRINQFIVK